MSANSKFGERHDLTTYDFDPGATTYTAFSGTWISLADIGEVVGILSGVLLTDACTIKIQGATSSSGTGATDIVVGTEATPDAAGDYVYVSATHEDFARVMANATHFMVLAKSDTGTDEGLGIIITERQRRSRDELANSIA